MTDRPEPSPIDRSVDIHTLEERITSLEVRIGEHFRQVDQKIQELQELISFAASQRDLDRLTFDLENVVDRLTRTGLFDT